MDLQISPLINPANATVLIPGSKSYTNRSLILAALTVGKVILRNPLYSDDTVALINCLKTLGIKINTFPEKIEVIGDITQVKNKNYELNANFSGTTIRFILALSCIVPGIKKIYGGQRLNERPIKELVEGLKKLGANITYLKKDGFPPLLIKSSRLNPEITGLKGDVSSQYFSAILMIAPLIGNIEIKVLGEQISKPYIDMTIDTMEKFGVKVINENYQRYKISSGQKYKCKEYLIEGDFSSAGYFFAISALTKSKLKLENLNPNSKQADLRFLEILEKMGNKIINENNSITIKGTGVKAITVNMQDFPDQVQTLSVLASFAKGVTVINGIKSLRIKETERVIAIEQELKKMGIRTESSLDQLTIFGGDPKPTNIKTYGDHRMAMSFAIAGSKLPGIIIEDSEVVGKTFPQFWEKLKSIGIKTTPVNIKNIVLIGMRGSGKTTIAKILSKKLCREYIDIDKLIVKKNGFSIPEIVEKNGWDYFRIEESKIVKEVSLLSGKIISTGGGVVLKQENISALKQNGIIIFLKASPEILFKRIGFDQNRPSLTSDENPLNELKNVLKQRINLYEKASEISIDTNNLTLNQISEKIKSFVSKMQKKLYIVIGYPIEHSLSPLLHNTGYKALGIDDEFIYKKRAVKIENLPKFIDLIRKLNIHGVSLTMPHKLEVIRYLDDIDKTAKKIGAVNTIVNDNGRLKGFNTDWLGVILPLKKITNLKNKKTAIIGAGGSARAAVFGLIKSGCKVTIFNRSIDKAKKLSKEFNCDFLSLKEIEKIKNMDIIFNTVPVDLIPEQIIQKHHIIFDAIYSPRETKLIKKAINKGATIILGLEMLLYQGIFQFELFTNRKAPIEKMKEALEKND